MEWLRKTAFRAIRSEFGLSVASAMREYAPFVRAAIQPLMFALHRRIREYYVVSRIGEEPEGLKRRLLIDVSTTFHMTHVSGIQRTVRSLVAALKANSTKYELEILPVRLKQAGTFFTLVSAAEFPSPSVHDEPVALRPRDSIFMLDSSWDIYPKWAEAVFPLIRSGDGKVITCVYDILPVTHPAFFTSDTLRMFNPWFRDAVRESDLLLSISKATKDEVDRNAGKTSAISDYFHLGADFTSAPLSQPVIKKTSQNFLMVGTIEPRKGHATVLDAFERLWSTGSSVSLVFVGRPGWKTKPVVRRIARLAKTQPLFRFYPNATDELLAQCYRDADIVIAASLAEGFGLPLVETLMSGKPLIASDIPAFREVAGNLPTYFEPGNPDALAAAVVTMINDDGQKVGSAPPWLTWSESADQLMAKIAEFLAGERGKTEGLGRRPAHM